MHPTEWRAALPGQAFAPRLSICIPTYNFGSFIGEALDSILAQWHPDVEIVILDSASTDDTPRVVQKRQGRNARIRYERAAEKLGIDRDMARVVGLARGDYCWLFSADDVMRAGALAEVLVELDAGHDVFLGMHSNTSIAMQPIDASHPVLDLTADATYRLSDPDQQLQYFRLALSSEAFFSFMGSLIIKRATWNRVPLNLRFVGTCWAHVARLFELAKSDLTVRYLVRVLLHRRGENDSFAKQGIVHRYALALDGYQTLADYFWGAGSDQAFHIRRVLLNEFRIGALWRAKAACQARPELEDIDRLNRLVARLCADPTWRSRWRWAAYRSLPSSLFGLARAMFVRFQALRRRLGG